MRRPEHPISYLQAGVRQQDILLGNGFLERGCAALVAGASGIGKSSIAMQCGCCWSCAQAAFDLAPSQALRIVMVQNEDSRNDLARMSEAIRHLNLNIDQIRENFWIETVRGKIGPQAVDIMRDLVRWRKADLLLINPLSAYHDGNISENRDNIRFLYGELGDLMDSEGIGIFAFHHKGKPPKDAQKNTNDDVYYQVMYDILGGSVLTNFFRGIITVTPIGNSQVFNFTVAKRFEETGWPLKCQSFKWHDDKSKRLWVAASVIDADEASKSAGKSLPELLKLIPISGPVAKDKLDDDAHRAGFVRRKYRGLLAQALDESTPEELRIYQHKLYNPNGGPRAAYSRFPQPADQRSQKRK